MGTKTIYSPKKATELGRSIVFIYSFSLGIMGCKKLCRGILSPRNSLDVVLENMWVCAHAERSKTGNKNSFHCSSKREVPLAAVITCTKLPLLGFHFSYLLKSDLILQGFSYLLPTTTAFLHFSGKLVRSEHVE